MPINKEIEVKFLEINQPAIVAELYKMGALDKGEKLLRETIFYDAEGKWLKAKEQNAPSKLIRIRENGKDIKITYKCHYPGLAEADEIEFEIPNAARATQLLENIGFPPYRIQEQRQHQFYFNNCILDFKTWPNVPTYLEIEGESLENLKKVAQQLGLNWEKHSTLDSGMVLQQIYNIPIFTLKEFVFQ